MAKRDVHPQINHAITDAAEKVTLPQLLDKVLALIPEMNLVNLSTSVHRIAKLSTTAEARLAVQMHPVMPELSTAMQMTLQRRMRNLDAPPTCQALSNITWGLATIEYVDMQLLPLLTALVVKQIEEFKAFELCASLWAFARLGELEQVVNSYTLPAFRLAAGLIHRNAAWLPFRSLVMTVGAFATVKDFDEGLFHGIAARLSCEVQQASCKELVKIIRAYAVAGIIPEQLFEQVARKVLQHLVEFKPAELGCLLSDYAEFGLLEFHFLSEKILHDITDPALLHLLESFFAATESRQRCVAVSELLDKASQRVASMNQVDFQALVRVCEVQGCPLGTTPSVEAVIHGCRLLAAVTDSQDKDHGDVDSNMWQSEVGASSDSDTFNDDEAWMNPMSEKSPCSPYCPVSPVSTQASLPPPPVVPYLGSDQTRKEADTAAAQELGTGAEAWHLAQKSSFSDARKHNLQSVRGESVDCGGGEMEAPASKYGQLYSVRCTVKNTFLHFQEESCSSEDEELDSRLLELPAELGFIPVEVKGHGGLMAFRMQYRKRRISRAIIAKGARVA